MTTPNTFYQSLYDQGDFTITFELVPGQGSKGRQVDRLLEFAQQAAEDGRIKALSITDNPGGHPALAPNALGSEIRKIGIEPLLHFSLKDKNRNQVESHLFLYHRHRFYNLLVLGGDFPRPRYHGQAKPVFDLDSVQALKLMQDMEDGTYQRDFPGRRPAFDPIRFNRGCVVSPFKTNEAEQVWQYAKLIQKIRAGAGFIILQLGYDMWKLEELVCFLRENNLAVPVLGNVFVPSLTVARYMSQGGVPGVVISEEFLARMEQETREGNGEARLIRAAKMISIFKGLGYAGIHLGGNNLSFENVRFILDTAREMTADWNSYRADVHFPVRGSWYYYQQSGSEKYGDMQTTLNPGRKYRSQGTPRFVHDTLFTPANMSGRLFGRLCRFCSRTGFRTALMRTIEQIIKTILFRCRMCGDCTLVESAYICPQSGCPKKLLNGPCGGSRNQYCEVHPDRLCFWVRVYSRLHPGTTVEQLGNSPALAPKNWALDQTSSWINYYTGKDHHRLDMQDRK